MASLPYALCLRSFRTEVFPSVFLLRFEKYSEERPLPGGMSACARCRPVVMFVRRMFLGSGGNRFPDRFLAVCLRGVLFHTDPTVLFGWRVAWRAVSSFPDCRIRDARGANDGTMFFRGRDFGAHDIRCRRRIFRAAPIPRHRIGRERQHETHERNDSVVPLAL